MNAYLYERLSSSEDFYLEEVADVVEEGPEEYEGSEAQGRSVDDDFIDADEVLGRLESALGDDRASDGHVREPERGEPFQIGESQAAADDAGDDGQELEDDAVDLGVVGDLLGVDDDELLACGTEGDRGRGRSATRRSREELETTRNALTVQSMDGSGGAQLCLGTHLRTERTSARVEDACVVAGAHAVEPRSMRGRCGRLRGCLCARKI